MFRLKLFLVVAFLVVVKTFYVKEAKGSFATSKLLRTGECLLDSKILQLPYLSNQGGVITYTKKISSEKVHFNFTNKVEYLQERQKSFLEGDSSADIIVYRGNDISLYPNIGGAPAETTVVVLNFVSWINGIVSWSFYGPCP